MINKQKKAIEYFAELKKMVKKCPRGYKLVYDIDKGLFMVPENSEFNHGSSSHAPAILCSVGMSYNPHKADTDGYMVYVAEPIEQANVDLAAVSSNAVIESEQF
jgi:hypothetical protein